MEMESGKLFIGGISWDTNEERLKEYFQTFGEVIEAVIMKDRTTGRARGFGFVVFSDPAVAEKVVKEKHMIDGRSVEAKKAVPRDDQQILNRSSGSVQGSPGPTRTKKIFVGGLASSVTENDFKNYFEQFGMITDVVVMYDHNTQRPRGFGFITYESEESVDKALQKTFHELNGKMVEVKRAVPKESSPGPNRSQISGFNYGLSRANSFLNYGLGQGYNSPGYGARMDGRFSPVSAGRTGYPPFSPSSYNLGLNSDSIFGLNYGGNGSFGSNLGYGRAINPMYGVTSNRYADPIGYGMGGGNGSSNGGGGNALVLNSSNNNMWGNGSQSFNANSSNLNNFLAAGNGSDGLGAIWGNSNAGQGGGNAGFISGNLNYGNEESAIGYRRNNGSSVDPAYSYGVIDDGDNMFGGGGGSTAAAGSGGGDSFYADSTWRASSPDLEVSDLFGYNLGSGASDGIPKNSVGYVGYSVANRSNRGIAA
ncbi:putative RNA recognition motif domain, nucleotide-binding alpha-beta plait domain superfamily [Helianthus annuus]|uniref:RNA recognition motif domain, nucleotide-binding alpha-beta plait domain superfamily n=2 Tax=Helianthus annuus TaxID=4232 RepID=A0A9K3P193_HELAN|nr:heterogeneous nuclear ribonucleoprotein 1 [Helianthus annuus]XP_022042349.1 heterogeneous nuclear ribonucleoprotein 1 [Helianthus annuus]XP_022042355.1 heterogeneous nuclear ribonucleoprotein 1 [Helianthus annuus]KAF5820927.1 putative RNA recognition motif domain, nucleotide-binding alpha-beta plait domain superfamily [Helianthus annuus]KAJ0610672.1 putative RNA recognition motif domain, nucleotide-binding alpha-beta plait domain superfamily [Helianthus annuus]KAJ0621441.1 putative RNA reco